MNELPTPTPAKRDPFVKAARKAYRESELCAVDQLLNEQSRWQRKRTIADNKLADVRRRLDAKLKELATPKGTDEKDIPKTDG
jgi:hypothetical protein